MQDTYLTVRPSVFLGAAAGINTSVKPQVGALRLSNACSSSSSISSWVLTCTKDKNKYLSRQSKRSQNECRSQRQKASEREERAKAQKEHNSRLRDGRGKKSQNEKERERWYKPAGALATLFLLALATVSCVPVKKRTITSIIWSTSYSSLALDEA